MKKILIIALTLLSSAGFTACDLDRYPDNGIPEGEILVKPDKDEAQQIIFGIYSGLKSSGLYSGAMTLGPDIQSDLVQAVIGFSNTYGELYRWTAKSTNSEVEAVYGNLYAMIARCNFFLEKSAALDMTGVAADVVEVFRKCEGDVYFLRALCYSELIRLYCKAYDPTTAESELGVSIVTTFKDVPKPHRSSLKASYEQVLSDLKMAESLVKRDGYGSPYVTVGAIHSLYARVYLYTHEWAKAVESATKVIENSNYELADGTNGANPRQSDYASMWATDDGREVIFKVAMSFTDRGGALGAPFLGAQVNYKQYMPDFVPAEWVLNLYSRQDVRQVVFFESQRTAYPHGLTWPLVNKYPGNVNIDAEAQQRMLTNEPKVFRLSELYLIRAEANYRLGNEKDANADLTALRRKRILGYGQSAASGDQLFEEIRNERVKELFMEGFRLSDLKRWGLGFSRKAQESTVEGPNTLKVEAGNPLFTWPIPKHELDASGSQVEPNESND